MTEPEPGSFGKAIMAGTGSQKGGSRVKRPTLSFTAPQYNSDPIRRPPIGDPLLPFGRLTHKSFPESRPGSVNGFGEDHGFESCRCKFAMVGLYGR